ncbi:MAG: 2Fe-2S iron-sulfur cluster-binding protein [Pseudomonadota bacterium]
MEYLIKVMPSGHEFHALEQETLLDAALRSGLSVDFSCSSGSCGNCRARLLEGELGKHDFQDHRLSEAEKAQGLFLLCTAHAAGDLVIEAGEATSTCDIPRQQIKARVSKTQEVSEHLRILQLRTPRSSPLRFLAGQHVELTLPSVGSLDSSIASCPCNGSQLQFHIPYEPENPFVEQLFTGLRYGSVIEVDGPFGEMTLDDDSPRPLLMVAQDHELGPIKSLIEHAINLDVTQQVRLIWLARDGQHYLDNFCRSWGETLDDYRYFSLAYDEGELDEAQVVCVLHTIKEDIGTLVDWDIYGAGSGDFNQALHQGLIGAGADQQRLFFPARRSFGHLSREVASG